ncbi:MAG: acyl-CoA dehydrogenase family protein [Dehalococcoidia bacterium]
MDFDLSEFDGLRDEVRAWCAARWPNGVAPRIWDDGPRGEMWKQDYRAAMRALGERGWLCGGWPVEHGGGGWRVLKQAVFNELAAYYRIPGTGLTNSGTSIIGPTIMIYGSADQKRAFLPPIARGEVRWALGFSEPDAGSDLAGLRTRAVIDDDEFVVNGSKVWNHSSDTELMLLLARTNPAAPKHQGISQFILPLMGTRGVTIQPILDLLGHERWTLVTFEDVRLPRSAMIGEINRGWYQQTTSLDLERAQMGWLGEARRSFDELLSLARRTNLSGGPALADSFVRDRLGALAVELELARWIAYRVAYLQDRGEIPNAPASISKLWTSEVQQRIQRAGVNLLGVVGLLAEGSQYSVDRGVWNLEYWEAIGTSIAGGASEIQRNIIATRGLGMPR